jgi:2-polyprenyl-6-methoxyphenol hydroxylase-like FAD-dependent oxidoreductase
MPRALIAGAGIGGLFLANAMRELAATGGWAIDIVERATEFVPLGAGIVIHPNGMAVLAYRGLDGECRRRGAQLRRMELTRGDGRLDLGLEAVWAGAGQPTIALARPELHDILAHAAFDGAPDTIKLIMGRAIARVEATDTGSVVRFDDGSRGEYDLVIAADGVHSAIRRSMVTQGDAVSTGLVYFRFLAENVIGLDDDLWVTVEEPECSWGFIPLGGGRLHCFVQVRKPAAPTITGEDYLNLCFAPRDHRIARCLAVAAGAVHTHAAYMVRPIVWGDDTCALLGDAAHAISPTLSEGGSLAMEDGLALAAALGAHESIPCALAHYRSVRSDRVMWAHRMALAQVNALRRPALGRQLDPVVATRHMRQMYAPLRRSVSCDLVSCVGSQV